MGQHPSNTDYITPIKTSDGSPAALAGSVPAGYPAGSPSRGFYTLASGQIYVFLLGGKDCPVHSAHFEWDAAIILTTLTVEDCNANPTETADTATHGASWVDEDPTTAFVGFKGAGTTVTNGVVAVAGGAIGGCMFHIADTGAKRTRITAVVGGTGGIIRCSTFGKQ